MSILSLGVFVYFENENLAYLFPHRCSQITHICGICGAHGTSLLNMFLFKLREYRRCGIPYHVYIAWPKWDPRRGVSVLDQDF